MVGYRAVVKGQYDEIFRRVRPEDLPAAEAALAGYLRRVLDALALPDEGSYLDVGCGAGLLALAAARARPAMRVTGLDASGHAVRLASEAAHRAGYTNVAFLEGDAEDAPAGPHDRLSALSVFNLLPDKRAALRAWRRASRLGSRLVVTDGFALGGPGTEGSGPTTLSALAQLGRATGWRRIHQEDLTPLVRRLHAAQAWPWGEYVRPGIRYTLVTLEAV